MPLRLGIDLDGVVADMDRVLAREAQRLFGSAVARTPAAAEPAGSAPQQDTAPADTADEEPLTRLELSPRQERRLWRHVRAIENFWEVLPEIEDGAIARLGELAIDRAWQVIFLTKRPETAGLSPQLQSQRWLERLGFPLPSVYVVPGSRGRIAAALSLDVVVDDRLENCVDVAAESTARAVLVWRFQEAAMPDAVRRLGIEVVPSMAACFDVLAALERSAQERGGLWARAMRTIDRQLG